MSNALKGVLILIAISHSILIVVPVLDTLYSSISRKSKLLWCAFLIFLPYIGAAIFHFRYRASLFQEENHETRRAQIEAERQKHSQYRNDDY
jgi:Ca2+/H+ antiporter